MRGGDLADLPRGFVPRRRGGAGLEELDQAIQPAPSRGLRHRARRRRRADDGWMLRRIDRRRASPPPTAISRRSSASLSSVLARSLAAPRGTPGYVRLAPLGVASASRRRRRTMMSARSTLTARDYDCCDLSRLLPETFSSSVVVSGRRARRWRSRTRGGGSTTPRAAATRGVRARRSSRGCRARVFRRN